MTSPSTVGRSSPPLPTPSLRDDQLLLRENAELRQLMSEMRDERGARHFQLLKCSEELFRLKSQLARHEMLVERAERLEDDVGHILRSERQKAVQIAQNWREKNPRQNDTSQVSVGIEKEEEDEQQQQQEEEKAKEEGGGEGDIEESEFSGSLGGKLLNSSSFSVSRQASNKLPTLAVVTGSSNSGKSCIEELLLRYSPLFSKIKVGFRSAEKAAELESAPYFSSTKIEIIVGIDAAKEETLLPVFQGVDCALIVTPLDYKRGFEKDAEYSNNMIVTAHAAGVKHIVYVGSWTVHHPTTISQIASRFIPTESLLVHRQKTFGFNYSILRAGYFASNLVHLLSEGVRQRRRVELPADFAVPPVCAADIGRSAAAVMVTFQDHRHDNRFYEISGPSVCDGSEMAAILSSLLTIPILFHPISWEEFMENKPPAIVELLEAMRDGGRGFVPVANDVKVLTGMHTPIAQWFKENLAAFVSV